MIDLAGTILRQGRHNFGGTLLMFSRMISEMWRCGLVALVDCSASFRIHSAKESPSAAAFAFSAAAVHPKARSSLSFAAACYCRSFPNIMSLTRDSQIPAPTVSLGQAWGLSPAIALVNATRAFSLGLPCSFPAAQTDGAKAL
jgi:hypothetical protein